ncbi:MAG: type IVB secretion system lipoprotein DotD [Coxiellaceae bacterium]|nr:type IVB secretion system lipoprotein DotD [Coxiellaceae bacterium]
MKKLAILLIPTLVFLASCSSDKKIVDLNVNYIPTDRVPAHITDDESQAQIAEAATAIGHSLQELSAVQMTVHPPTTIQKPYDPRVIGMDKMASLNWTGPVEPVLKNIARSTHYQLRVIGRPPIIPVFISIDVNNKPIADILRDITYQVVMKADIALYPKSRTIELRYHGN